VAFALIFGNVGFMGYPVVASIFGQQAVFYAAVLNMVNTFAVFTVGTMMVTGGGPVNKTMTPILYIYNTFNDFTVDSNIVIAGAILVAILICAINVVIFRIIRSEKSMDD